MPTYATNRITSLAAMAAVLTAVSTAIATTPNPDEPWHDDPMLPPSLPTVPDGWDFFEPVEIPGFSGEVLEYPYFDDLPWLPCRLDVPSVYPTIQDAVDAADNDCVIVVEEGTYYENVVISSKAVRIIGDGDVHVWPATNDPIFRVTYTPPGHVMQFDGMTFSSVRRYIFDGGPPVVQRFHDGVAISAGLASVRVTNCEFTNLSAGMTSGEGSYTAGAGVFGMFANIEVERCDFSSCEAPSGGAIAAAGCNVLLDQNSFSQCNAVDGNGGAIMAHGGTMEMSQCWLVGNSASLGGHCYFNENELQAVRCLFQGGFATSGGAVGSEGVIDADVSSCHFRSNQASESADVWYHDSSMAQGPYLAANAFCNGHSTHGTTEGIVPVTGDATCPDCDGDTGMDDSTTAIDLLDVLEVWGTRDPFADLDGSRNVDLVDLMIVLAGFGNCGDISVVHVEVLWP
ncbi:MAG: hypothetical protein GY894_01655 [Planctomycetes bacterium]|nr:hypothetical protein [Planctomycetota bacterium]